MCNQRNILLHILFFLCFLVIWGCRNNLLLSMCPSPLLFTYHFGRFSVILYGSGATFTDPLCSFLILSFIVTPHIHLSILISFTLGFFIGLSLLPISALRIHQCRPYHCSRYNFPRMFLSHMVVLCLSLYVMFSILHHRRNVQLYWPKLFQAFSVNFTLIFFHECVHSIIPHQHM